MTHNNNMLFKDLSYSICLFLLPEIEKISKESLKNEKKPSVTKVPSPVRPPTPAPKKKGIAFGQTETKLFEKSSTETGGDTSDTKTAAAKGGSSSSSSSGSSSS